MQKQVEKKKYYVVRERAVPEVLLKVVEAKRLLESNRVATVQEAAERTGISRSSFYIVFFLLNLFLHSNLSSCCSHCVQQPFCPFHKDKCFCTKDILS